MPAANGTRDPGRPTVRVEGGQNRYINEVTVARRQPVGERERADRGNNGADRVQDRQHRQYRQHRAADSLFACCELIGGTPMSTPARLTVQDAFADIERIFALQQVHQWAVKASSAEQRKEKLKKLQASVHAHADEIVAAVKQDTRKPDGEIRVTEVLGVIGNIQKNIDSLDEWMKPFEVIPSQNKNDTARIVYEARGVC